MVSLQTILNIAEKYIIINMYDMYSYDLNVNQYKEPILNKLVGISSHPYVRICVKDLIMFSLSCAVVNLSFIFGKLLKACTV
jgi:hypothetical protein